MIKNWEDYDKSFSAHEIVERSVSANGKAGYYRVAERRADGSIDRNFSFMVTFAPGMTVVSGDIGEIIFDRTGFNWVRGTLPKGSLGYIVEKISQDMAIHEFSPEAAREWLSEMKVDYQDDEEKMDLIGDAVEVLESEGKSEGARLKLMEYAADIAPDCDFPDFLVLTDMAMYRLSALRCLCRLLDAEDAASEECPKEEERT